MTNNLSTVQSIYQCFVQGDVPGILARLADDVSFFNGSDPAVAPFGGEFKGKDGVLQFFQNLGGTLQTTHFEPSNFREENGYVLNDIRHDGVAMSTGKPFSVNVLFSWEFNDAGQVIAWKGVGDFSSINGSLV